MLGVKENEETKGPQITAQEEALKRNTDCVYFLASPLTCKKGIECEYRHSDIARLNPQDCWFWLNGNCLNPKCAFRHPPLDGLLGTQVTTAVNSLPLPQPMVPVASQGLNVPGKQAVPCIFFQKGHCLKGDMCPFMHGPYSINSKATQFAGATPVSESQNNKKTFGRLGKHTQVQNSSQGNVLKPSNILPQEKAADIVEKTPLRNKIITSRNASIAAGLGDDLLQYRPANVKSFSNGNSHSRPNRNHQVHIVEDQSVLNVKDADEVSRELSPGFDVLVDDELNDSEYYPEDGPVYTGHDGRILNATNDYGIRNSADYGPATDVDRDMYDHKLNYDSFDRLQGHYGREVQRSSSKRVLGGAAYSERRRYPGADSPSQINGSDLRHHLSKQKRNTGLRSIISRDRTCENYANDRSYQAVGREHLPTYDNLVTSQLRGRIKIPGRSVSPIPPLSEKEIERARHHSGLPSERPLGRFRDRMKGRVQEDFINERNFRGSRIRRDTVDDNNEEFSGPKSLSELKVSKASEIYEHPNDRTSHGIRKHQKLEGGQQGEGDISFEGPKPLSEILKRKRGNVAIHESGSTNGEEPNQKERKDHLTIPAEAKESNNSFSSAAKNEGSLPAVGEFGLAKENNKLHEGQSSLLHNTSELQIEEGMVGDEAYDQREDDFDYDEQADGKDYNLEEGENADPEEVYFEEDDDADDFAKKMGVVFS